MPPARAQTKLKYDPSVNVDNTAKAEVADPSKYGRPDPLQQRFVGSNATVIPRASGNMSLGHNQFTTTLNIVDMSEANAPPVKVDVSSLDKELMDSALSKAQSAENAWELVRDLQKTTKPAPVRQAAPAAAPAPSVSQDLLQQLGALQHPVIEQPVPQSVPQSVPQYVPPAPAPVDNKTDQTLGLLIQVVSQLAASQQTQPKDVMAPQQVEPVKDKEDPRKPRSGVLENLGMEFLGEWDANKPTYPAFFDMGEGGQMSVKYHYAQVYNGLVTLVYDSRWDGAQFMPPNVERPIRLKLPDQKFNRLVYSRDCVFPLGKLEVCLMVIADSRDEPQDNDDVRPQLATKPPKKRMPLPTVNDRPQLDDDPVYPEFADDETMGDIL